MTGFKIVLVSALALTVAGCSLAPKFTLPGMDTPAAFTEADKGEGSWKLAEPAEAQSRGAWWLIYNDEVLNKLQDEVMSQSPSLQAMAARVKQGRLTARIATSALFPSIDGNASFTRQKPNAAARGMGNGELAIEENYKTGFGLSYELDLFGRVLNNRKAAIADANAMEAGYESMKLALQADVAALYFTIRALDAEIALLTEAVKVREESVSILKKRLELGSITELDSSTAIVDLETTRADLLSAQQQRKEGQNALAVLLGVMPENFMLTEKPMISAIPDVPAGLPSRLLERRPDIAAAQERLIAANARIGVARAGFFPNISLTGSGGVESGVLGQLFQWSSRSWAVGPLVTFPIFGGGKAIANHARSKAAYEEEVANYKVDVLNAFRDVEDSLSMIATLKAQKELQDKSFTAAQRADDIAQKRYDNGDLGYLEAITARKTRLDIERNEVRLQQARLNASVQLIRALGGGWN